MKTTRKLQNAKTHPVLVEFRTAGNAEVSEDCAYLQGKIFTADEASYLKEFHLMCECIIIPLK